MTTTNQTQTPLQLTIHPLSQGDAGSQVSSASNSTQTSFLSGSDGTPSFKDFLDTINPLQHIPVVSNIYQAMTGDIPSSGAKIAGDTLFGGPLGLAGSIVNSVVQTATGTDISGNIMAAINGYPVPALIQAQASNLGPSGPINAHQQTAYNAYVQTQNMLS